MQNYGCSLQSVELKKLKITSPVGEPLKFVCWWGNIWEKVDPAVLRFDLSTLSKILAKHQFISRIVLAGPGLEIILCCLDTLAHHQGRSLPSQPLSEIFISFYIVDLVFRLFTFYTCDCWARPSTNPQSN